MEERSVNLETMPERIGEVVQVVRRSEAYPAILGAVAGGIAGGLIAVLVAGRVAAARSQAVANAVEDGKASKGWTLREIVQLATISATLIRQIQTWMEERKSDQT